MTELGAGWAAPGATAPAAAPGPVGVTSGAATELTSTQLNPAFAASGPASANPGDRVRSRPVPMRPMTVLETIDGAAGAVRGLTPVLVVRACAVAGGVGLVSSALMLLYQGLMIHLINTHTLDASFGYLDTTLAEPGVGNHTADFCAVAVTVLILITTSTFASALLSGYLARPVQRYVDGAAPDLVASADGRAARIVRYSGLALLATLPRLMFTLLLAVIGLAAADDPDGSYAGPVWLLMIFGLPLLIWLAADFSIAGPAAALERSSTTAAFGRARRLVSHGRWRTAWTAFLTLLITFIGTAPILFCQQYVASAHGVDDMFRGIPATAATWWWAAAYILLGAAVQMIVVPVRACAAVLMYVDRRFRREGLDIRIAWARVARAGAGTGR